MLDFDLKRSTLISLAIVKIVIILNGYIKSFHYAWVNINETTAAEIHLGSR